jgi:hypothetical protein
VSGLSRRLSEDNEAHLWFRIQVAARGHINANRTGALTRAFVEALEAQGTEKLFSRASFLPPFAVAVPRENDSPVAVDWTRVASIGDELDVAKLSGGAEEAMTIQRCLMVLALAERPEFEVEPFLEGVKCKQNVPWFLARTQRDLKTFYKRLQKDSDPGCSSKTDAQRLAIWQGLGEDLLNFLLVYRAGSIPAVMSGRWDKLLGRLLDGADLFYRYYNHPVVRFGTSKGVKVDDIDVARIVGLFCKLFSVSRLKLEEAVK